MENKGHNGPERRKHSRIVYKPSQRPSLEVKYHKLEIVDISEGGARIKCEPNVIVFDKPFTQGTINLLGGDSIDIVVEIAWIMGDEIRLKFRNLIPSATIEKEREEVEKWS
ncbi:MAG: PilZ domain-containing protein [Deltaproteobacteria bacterium]|nr:MAG: PilZ domain-containing protein [Deltaproteobacteria bacterium]